MFVPVMMPHKPNIIVEKSNAFADRIGKMCSYIQNRQKGHHDMVRQINRSGTSIGANIAEGVYAQSGPDFINKFSIALKEANETKYWLERLYIKGLLAGREYESILKDNLEIIYILTSIIKTMKGKLQNKDGLAKNSDEPSPVISNHNF